MSNLKTKCECMTRLGAKFSESYLKDLEIDLAKIDETKTNKNQLQILKKKVAKMTKLVDSIEKGAKIHDEDQKQYMRNLIELVKKRDINTSHKRKKITTVPWEIGKAQYEQQRLKSQKKKKKQ